MTAQTITIDAEYVDINGNITAGQADPTLNITDADIDAQIATIRSEGLTTPQILTLSSANNLANEFTVEYDPGTNSVEVQPVTLGGGAVIINGHISSTAKASINAFGYYGNATINNLTSYNLIVDGVNASAEGAGIVKITDLNQTSNGSALQDSYITQKGGGYLLEQNWVSPTTGAVVVEGTPTSFTSNSATFSPLKDLRYTFTVAYGTETKTDTIYYSSSWLGAFHISSGTSHEPPTTTVIGEPQVLSQSLAYYVDAGANDAAYIFNTSTSTTSDTGNQPLSNWSTSTWYGKKTYYQEVEDTTKSETFNVYSIAADLAVTINFTGQSAAGITVNSPNSSVLLLGNLQNVTGSTTIIAGGSIASGNPQAIVEGVQVNLTAGTGIGSAGLPINVVLASGAGQVLNASTTSGAIVLATPEGNMAVGAITAGQDNDVTLTAHGAITVAAGQTGLVTGGNVTIVSGGNVGSASAALQLAVGQQSKDQLNLSASGDVYVEQASGDLQLFAMTAGGDATIVIDNGSLVNVNTHIQQDSRTTAQLESGVWSELALTGSQADDQIQSTLNEYQLSQEQQYQAYWNDRDALTTVNGQQLVTLSSAQNAYYTNLYGQQAAKQGLTGSQADDFVNTAINTLEISLTQQYYNLAAVFGAGGSYAPGTINTYDAAHNVDVTTSTYNPNVYNSNFVYLLSATEKTNLTSSIHVWTESELLSGISAGLLQTTTSTQTTIEAPNITAQNINIVVKKGSNASGGDIGTLVNPVTNFNPTANVIGFAPGSKTDGTPVQLALAAAELSDVNFLAAVPDSVMVNFSGDTMTLQSGSWANLNIQMGDYLYIGGSTQNATTNGGYLKVASISGSTVTFTQQVQTENNQTILVAPVVTNLGTTNDSTVGTIANQTVNFGNVANNGTITLVNPAPGVTWASLGYAIGGGVYIQSATDPNGNGAAFNLSASNAYYTIAAISDATITLNWGEVLTPEQGVTIGMAPVTVDLVSGANNVKFVLVSQSRDVAVAPAQTLNASSQGFIYLGSQANLNLGQIDAGTASQAYDVRIKTQGSLSDAEGANGVNVLGSGIVLEAGQGAIGVVGAPVVIEAVGTNASLTARALDDIYISAPEGDIPVEGIYSASGGVWLDASGSIYDAIQSNFAKMQANWFELQAGGDIGSGVGVDDALHIDLISTGSFGPDGTLGDLRAEAHGDIDIDQTAGSLYVLDVYSATGDVTLGAAGSLLNAGNLSVADDLDSAVAATDLGAIVFGNTIVLDAGQTQSGGIGDGSAGFNIVSSFSGGADSGSVTAIAGAENIYLYEVATTLNTTSNGDIGLMFVSSGADDTAFITAAGGSILNARPNDDSILAAGKADLIAQGNVGSGVNRAGGLAGRIVSSVGNIEASSTAGDIWLWNLGALFVGKVVPTTPASPYALYAPEGQIDVKTSSPLTIGDDVFAGGAIVKQAGNAADLGNAADILNSTLTVEAGVTIQSQNSYVELDALDDVIIQGATVVGHVTTPGALIEAGTAITISAGYLLTTTPTKDGTSDNVSIGAGAVLTAGTSIAINAGNGVTVAGASGPIAAAQLNAQTAITIKSGYLAELNGGAGGFDGNATTLDLFGNFNAPILTVATGGAGSDVEFSPSALTADTFINAGGGDNLVHLFNFAELDQLRELRGQLRPIPRHHQCRWGGRRR